MNALNTLQNLQDLQDLLTLQTQLQVPMDVTDPNSLSGWLNHEMKQAKVLLTTGAGLVVLGWFLKRVIATGFAIAGAVVAGIVGIFIYYMVSNGFSDGEDLIEREINGIHRIQPAPGSLPDMVGNEWRGAERLAGTTRR